jgi:hypothetical protein
MISEPDNDDRCRFFNIFCIVLIVIGLMPVSVRAYNNNSLNIVITDAQTGEKLDGVFVYIDGSFSGTTPGSDGPGTLQVTDIMPGIHTMRVAKPDYRETAQQFTVPIEKKMDVIMNKGDLFFLKESGPHAEMIDVIFIPSTTSFNCTNNSTVTDITYIANESRFLEDVQRIVNSSFLNLDRVTSSSVPLQDNYQDRFNFYYYYNPSVTADAFSGCAGTVPDSYWQYVTFADITVILYPTYYGVYSNYSCQPAGCYQSQGPGRSVMKVPANKEGLFMHETGHAIYGLVDTYCGNTYYFMNTPHPNVWSSVDACRDDAQANSRNSTGCRQIIQQSPGPCLQQFWRWDPDPDIMRNVYSGTFGPVATQRISYVLMHAGSG